MKGLPAETDFVVLGASIAGLRAAIELSAAGRVLLLAKKELPKFKSADVKAEAAWLNDEDEWWLRKVVPFMPKMFFHESCFLFYHVAFINHQLRQSKKYR